MPITFSMGILYWSMNRELQLNLIIEKDYNISTLLNSETHRESWEVVMLTKALTFKALLMVAFCACSKVPVYNKPGMISTGNVSMQSSS